jgi:outer membrane receptor for ferric coprogen and ferric-rhodotorulic acid
MTTYGRYLSSIALAFLCGVAVAQDPVSRTIPFNIQAQPVDHALKAFAGQSGLQVLFHVEGVQIPAGLNSPALNGSYTAEVALEQLLSNTGLRYEFINARTVTIRAPLASGVRPTLEHAGGGSGEYIRLAALDQGMQGAHTAYGAGGAQEEPSGEQAGKADDVDEVIVRGQYTTRKLDTATGLGLSLQDTPQSVSIITAQRLEDQNLRSLTDVVQNVVGISAKEIDSSRYRFAARGFDIQQYQVDGVPVEWQSGWEAGESLLDTVIYERIEVVRGATGLLTGTGEPSASINLVRKRADSREFTGSLGVIAGDWNTYGGTADLGGPLGRDGGIRGRVVAAYQDGDSFTDWMSNEKTVLYGVLDADLGETAVLSIGASYQDSAPLGTTWGALPSWFSDGTRTDWEREKTTAAPWTTWSATNESYFASLTKSFGSDWQARLHYTHTNNSGDLKLLYLYGLPSRTDGTGMGAFPQIYSTTREQDDVGIKLSGTFGWLGRRHEVAFGANYSDQNHLATSRDAQVFDDVGNYLEWDGSFAEPPWGGAYDYDWSDTRQTGVFASTRLALTEEFKVILGGRYGDWQRDGDSFYSDAYDFGESAFIPYAGALYTFNDQHTVYASFTEIFQPQNSRDIDNDFLEPLTGKGYEAGYKSSFFDDRLYTTVALFKIDQENLAQRSGELIPGTNPPQEAFYAAQGTQSEGYELEVVGTLARGWDVSFSFTDFDAKEGRRDTAGNEEPSGGINTHQPRQLLRLFNTYRFAGALQGLTIGGGINWETDTYTAVTNPVTGDEERLTQDAFTLVNLMARYDFRRMSVQLNLENVTDETYYSQVGFYTGYAYGRPRNATLNVRYHF